MRVHKLPDSPTKALEKALQLMVVQLLEEEFQRNQPELESTVSYMKKKDLCSYLNLSNNTVDKLIASGLPKIDVEGVILYERTAVDIWLNNYSQSA